MENKEVTLTLKVEEVNAILAAINELPARVANPLSKKIVDMANAQLQPVEEVPNT